MQSDHSIIANAQCCLLWQWSDEHAGIVADQAREVVRITGEHNCRAGAERGGGDEGVYRMVGIETVAAQQVPGSGRDRTIGINHGQLE